MKKIILLIICVFFLLNNDNFANARRIIEDNVFNKNQKPFYLGLEAGFNTSTLHGNDTLTYFHNAIADYTGGITLQYYMSKKFSVNSGITYSQTGTKFRLPVKGVSDNAASKAFGHERFYYISIPLSFKVEHGGRLKYFLYGGGYYAFLLKQERAFERCTANYGQKVRTNEFSKSDVGVTGGLGISYTTQKLMAFTFDVRNNFGLTDISTSTSHLGGTVRTYSTSFLFCISFPVSK
jgi:hypothetical protein